MKIGKTRLIPYIFFYFDKLENTKTHFSKKNNFQRIPNGVFVFSKIVLKSNFKKQESNRPSLFVS